MTHNNLPLSIFSTKATLRVLTLPAAILWCSACGTAQVQAPAHPTALTSTANKPLPAGGISLLGDDPMAALQLEGPTFGSAKMVDVQGQPFQKAWRLETLKRADNAWNTQISTRIKQPVKKDDVILARFYARAIRGQAETGEAQTEMVFETVAPNWSKSVGHHLGIPREWKRFDIPFIIGYDSPADGAQVLFRMGYSPQIFEVADFQLLNFGNKVNLKDLPRTPGSYSGQALDAPWRKAALGRIEKIRKGDLRVLVTDAKGKPVRNAKVDVRMQRHAFGFGSAVASDMFSAQGPDADKYRELVKSLYNRVVIENHLKWPFWESWGKQDALKSLEWLKANNIEVRGHTVIWPGWDNLPKDLQTLKDDKVALRKRISDHFVDVMTATRGKVVDWDVINEPFSNHDLMDILGQQEMVEWFKMAKRLDPKARLFINDYPPLDGAASSSQHLNHYYDTIAMLQKNGAPVEGIGFQGHFGSSVVPPERVLSGLDRFAKFGLPIAITEFDMNTQDEELQANYMRDFLTATFSHPSVDSVIMWGFWETRHWMPNAALYTKDWKIKPHGQMWIDLVKKQWWTNTQGKTNTQGEYSTRGFYGNYQIVVTANGKSKTVNSQLLKGKSGTIAVKLT